MFGSSKLSADEMLPRREQNSSGTPRFPLNLIRTYNQIFNPRDLTSYYHLAMLAEAPIRSELTSQSNGKMDCPAPQAAPNISSMDYRDWPKRGQILAPAINPCLSSQIPRDISGLLNKRHRGEKKAIPEEQKDGKYFERRKRNNEAAKRSRDARKLREDRIAFRASILEQENAILKSQVFTLRDEISTLRQMIFPATAPLPMNSN